MATKQQAAAKKKPAAKKSPAKKTRKPVKKAVKKQTVKPVASTRNDPPKKKPVSKIVAKKHPNEGRTFFQLCRMKPDELQEIFDNGVRPEYKELIGNEFRGFNPPIFARILGFQKFKKGFFVDKGQTEEGPISGYNVFVRQNQLEDPHIATPTEDKPKRHGFYIVDEVNSASIDNKYPHSLLLNYGIGKNAPYNPERVIRDYLVRVDPGNPDLFLGKAFIAVGSFRIFSNFFVLDRYNVSNFDPADLE